MMAECSGIVRSLVAFFCEGYNYIDPESSGPAGCPAAVAEGGTCESWPVQCCSTVLA